MKKRHQNYIVTFCSRGSGSASGGSSTSICSANEQPLTTLEKDSTEARMERRQNSTTNLLGNDEGNPLSGDGKILQRLRDKFHGCLLGALVGDCVGTLFERDYSVNYTVLEDLYISLTNLSEDEKLMDLHGIDLALGPQRIKEILELKRQSCAIAGGSSQDERSNFLKPPPNHFQMRRNSALATGTTKEIPVLGPNGGSRRGSFSRPIERYSDDTVMTKSVLYSVIHSKGFDARHLARQLTEDYFLNMNRKFGGYIRDVFVQLRENGYQDPFNPAKRCSGGIGAQGNEAASRVSPIALYCWTPQDNLQVLVELAGKMAKITNAHRASVHGTVLQALAVHAAFNWEFDGGQCNACGMGGDGGSGRNSRVGSPLLMRRRGSLHHATRNSLDGGVPGGGGRVGVEQQPKYFCEQVLERMVAVEGRGSSLFENLRHLVHSSVQGGVKDVLKPQEPTYSDKLRTILEFLQRSQPPARIEVVERLGNGAKAIDSVPTAIYSFLFAAKNDMLPEMGTHIKSPILRTIFHAIGLGGETDTLASMAGAIAGAYWGIGHIPPEILRVCEGAHEIQKLADELFNIVLKHKGGIKSIPGSVAGTNICQTCHQPYK